MSVRVFIYQLINKILDASGFEILPFKTSNLDVSRFLFINWKFWIRTCPDFNYGHVRILIFWITKFQIRTCPDFNYGQVRISIFWITKFQIWTCPDFKSGHVRISIFLLQNFKSGRVQNSIPDVSGFQLRTPDSILEIFTNKENKGYTKVLKGLES